MEQYKKYKIIECGVEYDVEEYFGEGNNNVQRYWRHNELFHREAGPAVELESGARFWYRHGKHHNDSGPAIIYSNGYKTWWLNDQLLECRTQEEFEQYMRLKAFW